MAWAGKLRAEQKRRWLPELLRGGGKLTRRSCARHVGSQRGSVLVGGEKAGRASEVCLAISASKSGAEASLCRQLWERQETTLLGYPGPVTTDAWWPSLF